MRPEGSPRWPRSARSCSTPTTRTRSRSIYSREIRTGSRRRRRRRKRSWPGTEADLEKWQEVLTLAVRLAGSCHAAYLKANPKVRRRFNQAVLKAVYVEDGKVKRAEFTEVFEALFSRPSSNKWVKVPPAGFEPAHLAPEASALSPELRGPRGQTLRHRFFASSEVLIGNVYGSGRKRLRSFTACRNNESSSVTTTL